MNYIKQYFRYDSVADDFFLMGNMSDVGGTVSMACAIIQRLVDEYTVKKGYQFFCPQPGGH